MLVVTIGSLIALAHAQKMIAQRSTKRSDRGDNKSGGWRSSLHFIILQRDKLLFEGKIKVLIYRFRIYIIHVWLHAGPR